MPFDPSSAKLFEPESATLVEEEEPSTLEKLKAGAQVAGSVLSGMFGGGLGTASGTIAGIRQHGIGTEEQRKAVEAEASRQAEALTYHPTSPLAQEYMEPIGEFINRYVVPAAPWMAEVEGAATAGRMGKNLKKTAQQAAAIEAERPVPTLADVVAQAEQAPENRRVGPPQRTTFDPTSAQLVEEPSAAGAKNLRQQEFQFGEQPPQVTVSPEGTAMVSPEQVAGYEQYGRAMENPEAPVQAPKEQPTMFVSPEGEVTKTLPEEVRSINESPEQVAFAQAEAERKVREAQAKQAVEQGQTGNLFADYINQHRDYELFRDENGKPLSRTDFNETVDNLAKEPSTGYIRPENMDEAYAKYRENFNGIQAGLFDQPTQAKNMAAALKADAAERMADKHPLVAATEKFVNQEQQFLDQLKQQGASLEEIKKATESVTAATKRMEETKANVLQSIRSNSTAKNVRPLRKGGYRGKQGGGATTDFLSSMLSLGLDKKIGDLKKKFVDVTNGEKKAKYLPVTKGLEDYTKERRSADTVAEDIIKNNIPDIPKSKTDVVQAGGLYKQLETNNPVVRKTFAAVSEAYNRAHTNIRDAIQDPKKGLPALFRNLTKSEAGDWWMKRVAAEGVEDLTPARMAELGFNKKQVEMNQRLNEVLDFALQKINEARALAGKGPVDKRVGYLAGQASGDFRRLVYKRDAEGNKQVIGILGSDVRAVLDRRAKKLLEAHPEWEIGNETMPNRGKRDSRQKAFEDAVEMLAENNPDTKALMDAYDGILRKDAYDYMNAKKHTMQKKGIHGTEGFKLDRDAWTNAKEGMASQIRYIEKMFNWAEMSKAVHEVKPLLTNDKVNMPNAKAWSSDYIDRALGIQTSDIGHAVDSLVSAVGEKFGVGPSGMERGLGAIKGGVSKYLLGFANPLFLAINLVQPVMSSPAILSLMKGRGLEASMASFPKNAFSFLKMRTGGSLSAFEALVKKEGLARNIFGSEIFDHGSHLRKSGFYGSKVAELGIPNVEAVTRGTVFTHFADVLRENGYNGTKLFDIAENLTNQAMTDYRSIEAPAVYKNLGALGDMAVTLQRYKHNSLSSLAVFAREAKRNKNVRPMVAALATGIAFSGLNGMLGFNEADWLYQKMTNAMGKPDTLSRLVLQKLPDSVSFGAVSAMTGMDMSKRFGMSLLPDSPSGVLFPGVSRLAEPVVSGWDALKDPTNKTAWERFMRDAVPNSMRGLVDRTFFENENGLAINPKEGKLEGTVQRTPTDKFAKSMGGVGLHESKEKTKIYQESLVDKAYADKRQKITNNILDDLYQMKNTDEMRAYFRTGDGAKHKQAFIDAEGNIDNLVKAVEKFRMGGKTTAMQRKQLAIEAAAEKNPKQALRYKELTQE